MQKFAHLFFLFWTFSISFHVFGQQESKNKLSISLNKQLQITKNAEVKIPVLIKGDATVIKQFLSSRNIAVKFLSGNIVSAELNTNTIYAIQQLPSVEYIDCPKAKLTPLNDVMVIRNNVDSAYNGMWPLEQGYDGTGVVIGIIDAPFDYNHPDFTDVYGNTRIKYLWDQTLTGDAPDEYAYGVECDSASIADNTCPHIDYNTWYSHGSGVTGVAASSGNAANNYRGVAPNADLILVTLDFNNEFLTRTVDAIAYIYQKAAEMGKPCVINTSFGSYDGAHDGKDLTTQAINNLITESTGRALVAAGGNAGNQQIHLGYDVSETPQFTWFKKLTYTNAVYFQVFADTADFHDVFFSVGADNPTGWIHKGSTPDYNILIDYTVDEGGIDSTSYDIYNGITYVGNVKTYVQLLEGTFMMEVLVVPAVSTDYWRFTTHGSGKFDVWSNQTYTGFSNYVTTGLPSTDAVPEIINYRLPDYNQNIVGYWQCSDKVITVGSYVNRDTMTNYYGNIPPLVDPVDDLFYTSSFGPTRDGRIKPDIAATGSRMLTTGSDVLTSWLISLGAAQYISTDGMHYLQNGTSFASPVVAGIAALYFQKNPDANWEDVKNAILVNAKKDAFTGDDLPDNGWGYGKADAFRTLTGSWGCEADNFEIPPQDFVVSDITSTTAFLEWDVIPNAAGYQIAYQNLSSGVTVKKKSTSTNKLIGPLTPGTSYKCRIRAYCSDYGTSDWSAPVMFTTNPLRTSAQNLKVYPNPLQTQLFISGLVEEATKIELYNIPGVLVWSLQRDKPESTLQLTIPDLPSGFYIIAIHNGETILRQTIAISR